MRGGVSCAESIIFISRGTVTSFPIPISGREPAKCHPRESNPRRIDRFKMRELCVAVIPRCNDLSITSSRVTLYALVVLSSRFRSRRYTGIGCGVRLVVTHPLFAI